MDVAVTCPVQALTAHYLTQDAHAGLIKPGEWMLIHAAGGGTCQWAAQVCSAVRAAADTNDAAAAFDGHRRTVKSCVCVFCIIHWFRRWQSYLASKLLQRAQNQKSQSLAPPALTRSLCSKRRKAPLIQTTRRSTSSNVFKKSPGVKAQKLYVSCSSRLSISNDVVVVVCARVRVGSDTGTAPPSHANHAATNFFNLLPTTCCR